MDARAAFAFALLAGLSCLSPPVAGQQGSKLTVDVYYESLCPDSINFITKKLVPAYQDVKDFLQLSFVPFGKASWTKNRDSPANFKCQHGPDECSGNRAQACALEEIATSFGPEASQDKSVEVVGCVMGSGSPSTAVPQCAKSKGLSDESIQRIADCTQGTRGEALLIANGDKTKRFESPLLFVPSIAINGKKTPEAFQYFVASVCDHIKVEERPAACGDARLP